MSSSPQGDPVTGVAPKKKRFSILNLCLSFLVAAGILVFVLRKVEEGGLTEVKDDEVAVVVDYWSGTERVVTTPGYISYVPYFQQVVKFSRSPSEYEMKGNDPLDAQHVERLLIRANDGSSFWFGSFKLQYAMIPNAANIALDESEELAEVLTRDRADEELPPKPTEGVQAADASEKDSEVAALFGDEPGLSRPFLVGVSAVHAFARAILRDEFGRYTAEDVVRPENLAQATQESKRRLNELFAPHGIEIVQIATPKPQFDRNYEDKIERRKVANQETERLKTERSQLPNERDYRLAKVRKEMQLEKKKLGGILDRQVMQARQLDVRTRKEADIFYSDKFAEADAHKSKNVQKAVSMRLRYDKETQNLMAHASALETNGEASVRAALIKRLGTIKFNLVPYSRDPAPGRLEVEDSKTAATWKR